MIAENMISELKNICLGYQYFFYDKGFSMKKSSFILLSLCTMITSESSAMKRFLRHPKDIVRHPKKLVTAVVRAIENQILEPVAHAVENEVVEPVANGVNDHVIKPFCKGLKRKLEQQSEQGGEIAADVAYKIVVTTLTGGTMGGIPGDHTGKTGSGEVPQQNLQTQNGEGERPVKRSRS